MQLRRLQRRARVRGFTLIEIMVVVVILGILAALVVPTIMDKPDEARQARAKQDIRALQSSINMYRLENMQYPDSLQDLVTAELLDNVPTDPWGNPYQYQKDGGRAKHFDLYSFGLDGIDGGQGLDADIGNWHSDE